MKTKVQQEEEADLYKLEKLLIEQASNDAPDNLGDFTTAKVKRSAAIQMWMGFLSNLTCIAPSMTLGFSAILLPYLLAEDNPYKLTPSQGSWVASTASIATPVGALLSGPICDKYGRKMMFNVINIVSFVGWIIIAVAYKIPEHQYAILLVGRLVTGLSIGLASMPATVYIAEISSSKLRGMLSTWSAISFSIGVLAVYILGYINKENWFLTSVISAIIALGCTILVQFFVIESPSWLVSVGRCTEAKQNMCYLFSTQVCTTEVQKEVNIIINSKHKAKAEISARYAHMENPSKITMLLSNLKYFTGPTCLKPFLLMLAFFFFQQFSGLFVIIFYAVNIAMDVGVSIDGFIAAVLIAVTRLVGSVLVGFISKSYGRRPPSLISGAGMTISTVILGSYVLAKSKNYISTETAGDLSWLPTILLITYIFFGMLGFIAMPFAMTSELFPTRIRGTASGLLTCVGYSFNFITVKFFPDMNAAFGVYGVFYFFGTISLIGTIFVILFLPETKGKTLEEIEEYFGVRKGKRSKYVPNEEHINIEVELKPCKAGF